jgi:hypothetical protein
MNANIFKSIGDLAVSAKRRTDKRYADFLAFYRELVETLPSEMVEIFGAVPLSVTHKNGKAETVNIELSATDFLWWKRNIEVLGMRFTNGPSSVENAMLRRVAEKAETHRLAPEERKTLLAMLEQALELAP